MLVNRRENIYNRFDARKGMEKSRLGKRRMCSGLHYLIKRYAILSSNVQFEFVTLNNLEAQMSIMWV